MKEVTIDNVRERIKAIASRGNSEYGIGLTLKEEFELACLRQLVASQERIAELEESDREQMAELYRRNATIHRLQQQPAPVAHDAEPSLNAMMRALDAFYADDDVPERAMLAAFKILLADVRKKELPVKTLAKALENAPPATHDNQGRKQTATDNTAQQFEALATSKHGSCNSCGGTGAGTQYTGGKCAQCLGSGGGVTSTSEVLAALEQLYSECDTGERSGNGSLSGVAMPSWPTVEATRQLLERVKTTSAGSGKQ